MTEKVTPVSTETLLPFAVIGTREPSQTQIDWVRGLLEVIATETPDGVLHTGAAPGIDQLAANDWLHQGKRVHLHLPWKNYEPGWVAMVRKHYPRQGWISIDGNSNGAAQNPKHERFDQIASLHHPLWSTLKPHVRALHQRNVGIIEPCDAVFAAPGTKPWGGGTAMGIKIALHLGKELRVCDPLENTRKWDICGCPETTS